LGQDLPEDEKKVIAALDNVHDNGRICYTYPELRNITRIPAPRLRSALTALEVRGIVGAEDHNVTSIYYLKRRVKIEKKET